MKNIVREVTGLYKQEVWAIIEPTSTIEVSKAIKRTSGPISIGGGHFSMGGQVFSKDTLHIDTRKMNRILSFNKEDKTITVQAGTRWCEIQEFIDPYDLSIKIMQTYANFTVGGSVSVNCHGRYIGYGPLILSIINLKIVLANGEIITASPIENSNIFFNVAGCYGALGVITEITLSLTDNVPVKRLSEVMPLNEYSEYFKNLLTSGKKVVFHNADIYPPHYSKVRATSWIETNEKPNIKERLNGQKKYYLLEKYFFWAISETIGGKWRRENIVDNILFSKNKIHWRNYEAGYDVMELEPLTRKNSTYVLQEYFIPERNLKTFSALMKTIFQRYNVNTINVSIRHAIKDSGSSLAWADENVFAFVVYYKQKITEKDKIKVSTWTRELVEASINCEGKYYLPYQPHPTLSQFKRAYPRHTALFKLKDELDPDFRFRNCLWDKYYKQEEEIMIKTESEFKTIMNTTKGHDDMYLFLQNVFHLYPEDVFMEKIINATKNFNNDEDIYRNIQKEILESKKFWYDFKYTIPSLIVQKNEMENQTLEILDGKTNVNGFLEIGSKGRYYSRLKKSLKINGPVYMIDDKLQNKSLPDILERGSIKIDGTHFELNNYQPISEKIPDNSLDLVICYIGLHHIVPEHLDGFVKSISRVLKKDGIFILRDHDANDDYMKIFASLIHTVFNLGLKETFETDMNEPRFFNGLSHWINILNNVGLEIKGKIIYQANDPSKNALMKFTKVK